MNREDREIFSIENKRLKVGRGNIVELLSECVLQKSPVFHHPKKQNKGFKL